MLWIRSRGEVSAKCAWTRRRIHHAGDRELIAKLTESDCYRLTFIEQVTDPEVHMRRVVISVGVLITLIVIVALAYAFSAL